MTEGSATRVVHGLEAIIDAAAGVLAEKSLTATLNGMARALGPIVPFTSLAIYEADHRPACSSRSSPSAATSSRRWPTARRSTRASAGLGRPLAGDGPHRAAGPAAEPTRSPTRRPTSPRRWSSCRSFADDVYRDAHRVARGRRAAAVHFPTEAAR